MKHFASNIIAVAVMVMSVFTLSSFTTNAAEELTFTNLLDLLYRYGESEAIQNNPMTFLFYDSVQDGEIDCIEVVYGSDVEKGKKIDYGYEVLPTSDHACYFRMSLDTSTQASLYFMSKDDANQFLARLAKTAPVTYNDQTYCIRVQEDGMHISTLCDDGDYSTQFVVYQPVESDGGFYRVEIEVYM